MPQLRTSPAPSEDASPALCRHVVMHSILSDNDEGRSSVCDRREIHPRLLSRQGCRSGTSFALIYSSLLVEGMELDRPDHDSKRVLTSLLAIPVSESH